VIALVQLSPGVKQTVTVGFAHDEDVMMEHIRKQNFTANDLRFFIIRSFV
jgi:hypothetical protein